LEKKMTGFVLLFGVVDNRLLTRDQMTFYSQMPPIDQVRAQLCHTLGSAAQSLSQNLTHHTTALSSLLTQHSSQETTSSSDSSSSSSSSDSDS
jgi:hypothetical protein